MFQTVIKTFFNETKYNRTGSYFTTRALNWFWSSCVAALPVLAPLGCFIGSEAAKRFGRRKTLLLNNVFLVISALMQATTKAAKSYELFFFGRLFLGKTLKILTEVVVILNIKYLLLQPFFNQRFCFKENSPFISVTSFLSAPIKWSTFCALAPWLCEL